jgi:hypothetical protein
MARSARVEAGPEAAADVLDDRLVVRIEAEVAWATPSLTYCTWIG